MIIASAPCLIRRFLGLTSILIGGRVAEMKNKFQISIAILLNASSFATKKYVEIPLHGFFLQFWEGVLGPLVNKK